MNIVFLKRMQNIKAKRAYSTEPPLLSFTGMRYAHDSRFPMSHVNPPGAGSSMQRQAMEYSYSHTLYYPIYSCM